MDERKDQQIPKEATFKKWKEKFTWLKILGIDQQKRIICKICIDQENRSTNFKASTLSEQGTRDIHKCETEGKRK